MHHTHTRNTLIWLTINRRSPWWLCCVQFLKNSAFCLRKERKWYNDFQYTQNDSIQLSALCWWSHGVRILLALSKEMWISRWFWTSSMPIGSIFFSLKATVYCYLYACTKTLVFLFHFFWKRKNHPRTSNISLTLTSSRCWHCPRSQ